MPFQFRTIKVILISFAFDGRVAFVTAEKLYDHPFLPSFLDDSFILLRRSNDSFVRRQFDSPIDCMTTLQFIPRRRRCWRKMTATAAKTSDAPPFLFFSQPTTVMCKSDAVQ